MPLQQTSGNVTADAYGGGVAAVPKYIENFFSIWLRTGTGASATVTTGLDASINKTLVWTKSRSAATDHKLTDTVRGATKALSSNTTGAQTTDANGLTAFSSTGYTIGTDTNYNNSGATYVDWEFAATPKFFDVVTYTGTGSNTTIAHNLGSVPGCIIVKRTDAAAGWAVYHRSLANTQYLVLNTTAAAATGATWWNSTTPTSTVFSVGTDASVNASGGTYVAYLFAHDAGGFGLTGTDNVMSCGSFTTSLGGIADVNLGYEPQFVIIKRSNTTGSWIMLDTMRGFNLDATDATLFADTSAAETANQERGYPTATGFYIPTNYGSSSSYIYIAIRRGPMKVPTVGTSVYQAIARTATGANATISSLSFPSDASWFYLRSRAGYGGGLYDRLRGANNYLQSFNANAENTTIYGLTNFASNVGFTIGVDNNVTVANTFAGDTGIIWNFRRAPSFFDEVCYTGNDVTNRQITHNLGVAPELLIVKARQNTGGQRWAVLYATGTPGFAYLDVNFAGTSPPNASFFGNDSSYVAPTASVFTVGSATQVNTATSGGGYVAYLFATCPGVSKVGSYTGNGTTQTINCGFTGGARFVLIKRTDATGEWYVYDTTRGMTTLTDPYLLLNSTAAEVATLGSVTTVSTGFALNSAIVAAINVSGGSFVFLSIA